MNNVSWRRRLSGLPLLVLAGIGVAAEPGPASAVDLADAVTAGKVSFSARYRYEFVDQDGFAAHANASTVRGALGYATKEYFGVSAFGEFEGMSAVGNDLYQSPVNGKTQYPVVDDQPATTLHQIYGRFTGLPQTEIIAGRHEIDFDDGRLVGSNSWRQNHQCFDGASVSNESLPHTRLSYDFIARVHSLASGLTSDGIADLAGHLARCSVTLPEYGTATAYACLLDFTTAQATLQQQSTATYGLRLSGRLAMNKDVTLVYLLEGAHQRDYADNPVSIRSNFLHAEFAGSQQGVTLAIGYEMLGGSGSADKFTTPLASLHDFDGWAGLFAATPDRGLKDVYASLAGKLPQIEGLSARVAYHDFSSDQGSTRWGKEIDAQVEYMCGFDPHLTLGARVADFIAGEAKATYPDTLKVWLYVVYAF